MAAIDLYELVVRLSDRDAGRSEAQVQSEVRNLLLYGGMNLVDADVVLLEAPVGKRRRIDVQVGTSVIEVKRDLRVGSVLDDAVDQLSDYVAERSSEQGQPYVGILTDGATWILYHLRAGELVRVSEHHVNHRRPDVGALTSWLEAVLSTGALVRPEPRTIEAKLGAKSPSYALDIAELSDIWTAAEQNSEVRLKRQLWADLVTTAQGTAFVNSDQLFVQHSYLVVVAELVAHEIIGVDPTRLENSPADLLAGKIFYEAQVYNVVEPDFFDWPIETADGPAFVRRLARRIHQFDWSNVEHDVLKVLYESVIDEEQRKKLGETYTPDWLAQAVVETAVDDPGVQRVHDPACGSGTFLFHAVRAHIAARELVGDSPGVSVLSAARHVSGVDIHPVAVTLARVTYLLAIGHERLQADDRGPLHVPIYLGDSCQWDQAHDLFSASTVRVATKTGSKTYVNELMFPRSLLKDAANFDGLVVDLIQLATHRVPGSEASEPEIVLDRYCLTSSERQVVRETYVSLCHLHDQHEDGIWGYYVRNLVRPIWLTQPEQRVDILIGNPPWLGYKFMTAEMQKIFRSRTTERGLWAGGKLATQMDLSTYFVVRCVELYLKSDGKFAMILPRSVLSRKQYAGFRLGGWSLPDSSAIVADFTDVWDLFKIRPHFFPVPACVTIAKCQWQTPGEHRRPSQMPSMVSSWTASMPNSKRASWDSAKELVSINERPRAVVGDYSEHPYFTSFSNGATLYPRMLFSVKEESASKLGSGAGRVRVTSVRSANENKPWKELPNRSGTIERKFMHSFIAGEELLPFGLRSPRSMLLPISPESGELLESDSKELLKYSGMNAWWKEAEGVWTRHRKSDSLSLIDRINYMHGVTGQLPIRKHRVVYNASGMHLCAAYLADQDDVLVDNTLYWAEVGSKDEAMYLCTILNSDVLEDVVVPLMASGKDERHFHKLVFALQWPKCDVKNEAHRAIIDIGYRSANAVDYLRESQSYFVKARSLARAALDQAGLTDEMNSAVTLLANSAIPASPM